MIIFHWGGGTASWTLWFAMFVVLKLCLTVLINYFFDYQLPTALLQCLNILQGSCSPHCPSWVTTPMILIVIEIKYSDTALSLLVNPCIPHWNAPHLHIYRLKRRRFMANCVQPIMQQYKSTTVPQNQYFSWWAKMNGTQKRTPWRMHCMYSGMAKASRAEVKSNSEKNQAHSLSHCWATRVWRHQASSQAGSQ